MDQNDIRQARKGIQILKDPFLKECVEAVHAHATKGWLGNGWRYWGNVQFKNGDTEGNQKFEAESYSELLRKIENFIDSL